MARKILKGAIDSETDPFEFERIPVPFSWGVVLEDGERFLSWGVRSTFQVVEYLLTLPECELYAHNGGKFDFHFLLPYANRGEPVQVINGRIAKMRIGGVTLIDSFLLIPFALAQYKKTEIDYRKFERDVRQRHKKEIQKYQIDDCVDLLELVTGFQKIAGKKLTIGGAAFAQMKKMGFNIPSLGASHDERFRPFYFGGRVEAFKPGVYEKCALEYVDINSAYPFAMMQAHPTGPTYKTTKRLPKKLGAHFVEFDGVSRGALPVRDDRGRLQFPVDDVIRRYHATGWEVAAGLDTGTIEITKIHAVHSPVLVQNYEKYVSTFYELRNKAKREGDKILALAAKYLLNSGYGKFATDPRKFKDYVFEDYGIPVDGFSLESDLVGVSLWSRPAYDEKSFFDVATAASITGFVRAYLWRAINSCEDVFYCDTDSIICKRHHLEIGDKLGQWSIDGKVNKAYIAGKKMYAVRVEGNEWKIASKGVRLNADQIKKIAKGGSVKWRNAAPTFSVSKAPHFVERVIKANISGS